MNGKAFSEALGTLPEDMVAEAMEPARTRRSLSWLRLAVCFVVVAGVLFGVFPNQHGIVTAPGILAVTVYASEENEVVSLELEEGVECLSDFGWSPTSSVYPGLPIQLSLNSVEFPPDEIIFEISVSDGTYHEWGKHTDFRIIDLPKEFSQSNHTIIYWNSVTNGCFGDYDHVYTFILIKCEDHIIGYSVLRFDQLYNENGNKTYRYKPFLMYSVMFPKVDGEYQSVSKEDIDLNVEMLFDK